MPEFSDTGFDRGLARLRLELSEDEPDMVARTQQPVTIRLSTGFPTGNFRPFSERLAKGYAQLMPDVRVQPVETPA